MLKSSRLQDNFCAKHFVRLIGFESATAQARTNPNVNP